MTNATVRVALLSAVSVLGVPAVARADVPREHEGFYLRMGIGPGYMHDSVSGGDGTGELTIKGLGFSGELLFGGTPAPGLVIGGGFQGGSFPDPKLTFGDQSGSADGSLVLSTVGPFVDYYPDPTRGLHFQGFVGFSTLSFQDDRGRSTTNNPTGFALSGSVGHEWFVSDGWSIGVMGRLQYLRTSIDDDGYKETHSVVVPAVLASFTYH